MKIAVLLTCFNRVEITKLCLNTLKSHQELYDVFLVDDGSTDDTNSVVKSMYPFVHVVDGSGDLFWSRGMHVAWKRAANTYDYDF